MALINRLTRLFQADFNAVLDRIEEPELQLKQAVREMHLALDQDQQRLALINHEITQVKQDEMDGTALLQTYEEEMNICLAVKKDDLARDLIRRKLSLEQKMQSLAKQRQCASAQIEQLTRKIEEERQQLAGMKQKVDLLLDNDDCFAGKQTAAADSIRQQEIEIALLREKEKRAGK